jgi:hypothetical protein
MKIARNRKDEKKKAWFSFSSYFKPIKKSITINALIEAIAIAITKLKSPKSIREATTVMTVKTKSPIKTVRLILSERI